VATAHAAPKMMLNEQQAALPAYSPIHSILQYVCGPSREREREKEATEKVRKRKRAEKEVITSACLLSSMAH